MFLPVLSPEDIDAHEMKLNRYSLQILDGRLAVSDVIKLAYLAIMHINENWIWQDWAFKAYTQDCNQIIPDQTVPDLIINTSTEHFKNLNWWNNIRMGFWRWYHTKYYWLSITQ